MTMHEINIKYRAGLHGGNKVEISGVDFAPIAKSVSLSMEARSLPKVVVTLIPLECTIDSQGSVLFDLTEIPEGLARDIYNKLQKKFDGDSA